MGNVVKQAKGQDDGNFGDFLSQVNMTQLACQEDADFVIPTNFPALSVVLLEFSNALVEKTVS